jgi:hypothetical protein
MRSYAARLTVRAYVGYARTRRVWLKMRRVAQPWRRVCMDLRPYAAKCHKVHRHLSPWATYGRGAIAQRVGNGLRPGKLRKKALGKAYEDGERPRAGAIFGSLCRGSKFSVPGLPR